MEVHELKTWPEFFQSVWKGDKRFEIRLNDRDYKSGDILVLREYEPSADVTTAVGRPWFPEIGPEQYSGFEIVARVEFLIGVGKLENGLHVYSLKPGTDELVTMSISPYARRMKASDPYTLFGGWTGPTVFTPEGEKYLDYVAKLNNGNR